MQRSYVPKKNLATISKDANKKKIFLIDKPDATQSVIMSGYLADPYGTDYEVAINMMNNILGGEFTSRVNMNLREDKGWAYGARTILYQAQGQRPYFAYAPVQTDKTGPSMMEIVKEFEVYVASKPASDEEFQKTKKNEVLSLNGQYETLNSVRNRIGAMVRYNLPEDYYQKYPETVRNLSLDQIKSAANRMIDADRFTWLVVGDRAKIEAEIRALGLGEVIPIDSDGNVLSLSNEKIKVEGN